MDVSRRQWMLGVATLACGLPCAGAAAAVRRMRRAGRLNTAPLHGTLPLTTGLAIDAHGERLATGGEDGRLRLWNVRDGGLLQTLEGHRGSVRHVAFAADGEGVLSAGDDGRILSWDLARGQARELFGHSVPISVAAIAPGDQLAALATFGSPQVVIVALPEGRQVSVLSGACRDTRAIAFDASGERILTGGRDGVVRSWRASTAELLEQAEWHRRRIRAIAFSPDGETIATAAEDGRVTTASSRSLQEGQTLGPAPAKLLCGVFVDPRHFITGGSDNLLRIWSLPERRQVETLEGHQGSISALACRHQLVVSAAYDATVDIWRLQGSEADAERNNGNQEG